MTGDVPLLTAARPGKPRRHRCNKCRLDGDFASGSHAGLATLRAVEDYTSKYKVRPAERDCAVWAASRHHRYTPAREGSMPL